MDPTEIYQKYVFKLKKTQNAELWKNTLQSENWRKKFKKKKIELQFEAWESAEMTLDVPSYACVTSYSKDSTYIILYDSLFSFQEALASC